MTPEKRILRRALTLLTPPGGWIRGRFKRKYSCYAYYGYCALGAVTQAAKDLRLEGAALNARLHLEEQISGSLVTFNDSYANKKADVLAVFKRAIAKLA